jgi:hypothetical protein
LPQDNLVSLVDSPPLRPASGISLDGLIMTDRLDVACGRALAARWQTLAEQRLEYLTELFESGRWRRYHSERAFLENIQEAKAAVGTWRNFARGPAETNRVIDIPQPDRMQVTLEPSVAAETRSISSEAPSTPGVDLLALERVLSEAANPALDPVAIEQRYPALRLVL